MTPLDYLKAGVGLIVGIGWIVLWSTVGFDLIVKLLGAYFIRLNESFAYFGQLIRTRRFPKINGENEGQGIPEYALIIVLFAVGIFAAIHTFTGWWPWDLVS